LLGAVENSGIPLGEPIVSCLALRHTALYVVHGAPSTTRVQLGSVAVMIFTDRTRSITKQTAHEMNHAPRRIRTSTPRVEVRTAAADYAGNVSFVHGDSYTLNGTLVSMPFLEAEELHRYQGAGDGIESFKHEEQLQLVLRRAALQLRMTPAHVVLSWCGRAQGLISITGCENNQEGGGAFGSEQHAPCLNRTALPRGRNEECASRAREAENREGGIENQDPSPDELKPMMFLYDGWMRSSWAQAKMRADSVRGNRRGWSEWTASGWRKKILATSSRKTHRWPSQCVRVVDGEDRDLGAGQRQCLRTERDPVTCAWMVGADGHCRRDRRRRRSVAGLENERRNQLMAVVCASLVHLGGEACRGQSGRRMLKCGMLRVRRLDTTTLSLMRGGNKRRRRALAEFDGFSTVYSPGVVMAAGGCSGSVVEEPRARANGTSEQEAGMRKRKRRK
ncbi:hypothetical protein DFH09DRAFT_1410988, partial [Mycena vulgaris]